jgi:hypothetical protein
VAQAYHLLLRVILGVEVARPQDRKRRQVGARLGVAGVRRIVVGHQHGAVVMEMQILQLDHRHLEVMDDHAVVLPRRHRKWHERVPGVDVEIGHGALFPATDGSED